MTTWAFTMTTASIRGDDVILAMDGRPLPIKPTTRPLRAGLHYLDELHGRLPDEDRLEFYRGATLCLSTDVRGIRATITAQLRRGKPQEGDI